MKRFSAKNAAAIKEFLDYKARPFASQLFFRIEIVWLKLTSNLTHERCEGAL